MGLSASTLSAPPVATATTRPVSVTVLSAMRAGAADARLAPTNAAGTASAYSTRSSTGRHTRGSISSTANFGTRIAHRNARATVALADTIAVSAFAHRGTTLKRHVARVMPTTTSWCSFQQ